MPSKLSFNIGLTEFQNTLLPHAQEYVDVFFRYTYHLSNQLIVKQVGVEPTEFNWEHLTDYLPLKSCTLNQAKYYLLFHCFLKIYRDCAVTYHFRQRSHSQRTWPRILKNNTSSKLEWRLDIHLALFSLIILNKLNTFLVVL